MMRLLTLLTILLLTAVVPTAAQTDNGHRMVVETLSGQTDVYVTSDVTEMKFIEIAQAVARLEFMAKTDGSVAARVKCSEGCSKYAVACYEAAEAVSADALESYIESHRQFLRSSDGAVEFIDLKPQTEYVVATLAYDEFGLPCETATLSITTDARAQLAPAQVGDFLYADGSWSTELQTGKTPVAIIFATATSAADQSLGYTHGYALALRDAGTAAWTTEADENESGTTIGSNDDADLTDLDGLTHTQQLLVHADVHPAACAARNYATAPYGTSGWFLPSTGQWLQVCRALGGLTDDSFVRADSGAATWSADAAQTVISAVNARLATAGQNYSPLNQTYYWASTERNVMSAYYLYIMGTYGLQLQSYYKNAEFTVRPVVAF